MARERLGSVVDRLAVGADNLDLLRLQAGLPDRRQRRFRIELAQQHVKTPDPVDRRGRRFEQREDFLSRGRRIRGVLEGKQPDLRPPARSLPNLDRGRVDPVHGCARH